MTRQSVHKCFTDMWIMCAFKTCLYLLPLPGYPSLRIEKNDLRSVTLIEAKAKVKDIAISRERVTLRDVLHEGISVTFFNLFLPRKSSVIFLYLAKQLYLKAMKTHIHMISVLIIDGVTVFLFPHPPLFKDLRVCMRCGFEQQVDR